jgi:tRNA nucleotidyltransferase (CCA-adding enzyme)
MATTQEAKLLMDALTSENVEAALRNLYANGVLDKFGPFKRLDGMTQGKYHHLDALNHTFEVVKNLKKHGANPTLLLAGLFHDTGKADTREPAEDGKVHFLGHEDHSQRYLRQAADTYGFEEAGFNVSKAVILVKHHMLDEDRVQTERSRRKLRKDVGKDEDLFDLLILKGADKASGAVPERADYWLGEVGKKFQMDIEKEKQFSIKDLAISGKDLVDLGVKQGKDIGNVLRHVFEMVNKNRNLNDRDILLEEARQFSIKNNII